MTLKEINEELKMLPEDQQETYIFLAVTDGILNVNLSGRPAHLIHILREAMKVENKFNHIIMEAAKPDSKN